MFSHATPAQFNSGLFLYCREVCTASCRLSFFLYPDVNGIVNKAGDPWGTGAPRRCKQGDQVRQDEGAAGDWFLLRA